MRSKFESWLSSETQTKESTTKEFPGNAMLAGFWGKPSGALRREAFRTTPAPAPWFF
jgi:hypothetical protein